MFCKDCGAQLPDDDRFCPNCGSTQATTPPAEPADFADKVRAAAKKVGSSTAFLIATICLTLVHLIELFALMPTGGIFAVYGGIIPELTVMNPLASLGNLSQVTDILGMIPGVLIVFGLWFTFFSCASRKAKVNTSGLTMIFVVNLVQMVVSCLILLCVLLLAVIALPEVNYFNYTFIEASVLKPVLIALLITVLIIFAFVLVYYIKVCTTISNIRSTLKTGVPSKRASRFVAILCYISGGICLMFGIFWLLSASATTLESIYADDAIAGTVSYVAFLSAVTSLLTAAAQIIFGALIFTYRRKMAALEEEDRLATFQTLSYAEPYTAPVYIPPEPVSEAMDEPKPANEALKETKRWDL